MSFDLDNVVETFTHQGYECFIKKDPEIGHFCGYVMLEKDHSFYKKDYIEILGIDVHGGLTFSDETPNGNWVIGFDCAHGGDFIPKFAELTQHLGTDFWSKKRVWTIEDVKNEIKKLIAQLEKIK